jgi:hypothetical protein
VDQPTHAPAFVRHQFESFSREDAVAIALQEWRLFGQPVDDQEPGARPEPAENEKPERFPGLWERVGEYWWLGQNANRDEASWTGKHDASGHVFSYRRDADYAWSAAFISYVMRTAGAGARFPYAPGHDVYINTAREMTLGRTSGWAISAEAPDRYAPELGDLICYSRMRRPLRFADLPAPAFPAHCDIVAGRSRGELSVIGGDVDDAVTLKHVPVTSAGLLASADGRVVDTRYPWFVVLRVDYQR